LESTVFAEKGL